MKTLLAASLILASQWGQARCASSLPLEGVVSIATCTLLHRLQQSLGSR